MSLDGDARTNVIDLYLSGTHIILQSIEPVLFTLASLVLAPSLAHRRYP